MPRTLIADEANAALAARVGETWPPAPDGEPPPDQVQHAKRDRAKTGERGDSGLYTLAGVLSMGDEIDYVSAMRPPDRFANVDKMLSDPSVWAAYMAWVMPLMSVPRVVVPGGTDPADEEIADLIRQDLEHTSTTMQQIRYEELLSVAYGVTIHSKVWEYREDGLVHLRNLSYRPPASIASDGWLVDEHGGPDGVVQSDPNGEPITLPIDEILMHIHLRVGGNITGRSGLRSTYKPWWYKDKLESVAAVAVERGAAGIPVGTQKGSDPKVSTYIERVLKGLRAHQLAFVKETEDFAFRLESITGRTIDPMPLLTYHSVEIFRSMLAQHVALGGTDVGSWALAKSDIDFLVMGLQAVQQRVEDTYNQHLVPQWVGFNWASVPRNSMPRIEHGPLNTRNVAEWFEAVAKAVPVNVVNPDDQVRAMAREILGIPEPVTDEPQPETDEELESEEPAEPGDEDGVAAGRQWADWHGAKGTRLDSEVKLEALGIEVHFVAMADGLDSAEAGMVKAARRVQRRQIRNLVGRGRDVVTKGDPELVGQTEVRFVDEMGDALFDELWDLYELGSERAADELQQQGVDVEGVEREKSEEDREYLLVLAGVMAAELADRLMRTWSGEVLRQIQVGGGYARSALAGLLDGLADSTIAAAARLRSAPALNMGRTGVIGANAGQITKLINSEVMDQNTCRACAQVDGTEVSAQDAAEYAPFVRCEGGSRCRGILIPVVDR